MVQFSIFWKSATLVTAFVPFFWERNRNIKQTFTHDILALFIYHYCSKLAFILCFVYILFSWYVGV